MPRRPEDTTPEPRGGRAAERLREFIEQRFPGMSPEPEEHAGESTDAGDDDQGEAAPCTTDDPDATGGIPEQQKPHTGK